MISIPSSDFMPPDVYLKLEENSDVKHEYRQGEVYAMAGASNNHVLIAGNFYVVLRNKLRGSGCLPFIADTKVRIETQNTYYYPDVVVTCDRRDRDLTNFLLYPCLIVEVLSETTEAFDRGDKFADYREIGTLQEYVLVSQTRMRVDVFRRDREGQWVLSSYKEGDTLHLASLDLDVAVQELYEDIELSSHSQIMNDL
ncbi:Uma2 family endonuclease [Oscillatoria sp. FACHB-1406]|uniref:Uma2 family endonuclease n=1 Tax=Oscillatoria sp. FACHB-1406 TaxID=2692846 RepID=UPI00168278F9|nr:Uma2 family endonuclease [Oscillatoria sp. FACHB-1406]MBD2578451.1 Uma2 family endonuclease [Oscillatoria sp. FACHB-1406]